MLNNRRYAKINVKVLVILIIITGAIILSLFTARHIRRRILSRISLEAGQNAYESKDWKSAYKNFQEYLGRNPDDVEILKKYAEARLAIRPIEPEAIGGVIGAYRKVLQLGDKDKEVYKMLAKLYSGIGQYDELAYIAKLRLENDPNDMDAPLWLAEAQINVNKFDSAKETLTKFINHIESLPEKYPQYIKACLLMSSAIVTQDASYNAASKALEWINKAIKYSPDSAEALVYRAKFYRVMPSIPNVTNNERIEVIRRDLNAADEMDIKNPQTLLDLTSQLLELGEYEKASEKIIEVKILPDEIKSEYFIDINDCKVYEYFLSSEIALRSGNADEALSLIEEALVGNEKSSAKFKEEKNRIMLLPTAIKLYTIKGEVKQAREYLDEYDENLFKLPDSEAIKSDYLQAIVAIAEGKPYTAIDILQPVIANNSSPEFWRLLANAYSQTNQHNKAINCILNYLNYYPNDIDFNKLLAKEYLALEQYRDAYDAASKAVSLNEDDLIAQLLRLQSGIRLAIVDSSRLDKDALESFSNELADLRLKYTENPEIRIFQAIIEENLGNTEQAISELTQAITDCNETTNIEMQLAYLYSKTGYPNKAKETYIQLSENDPNFIGSWISLAKIYLEEPNIPEVDKIENTRNCLEKGIESVSSQKDKFELSMKLASLEMNLGEREKGINLIKEFAEQNPDDIEVRLSLLDIKEIQQDSELSQTYIDQIKKIEGKAGLKWRLCQSKIWLMSDEWRSKQSEITDMLQYCITQEQKSNVPVLLLAELYRKQGDFKAMEDTYKQALSRNPLDSVIAYQLLSLLENQGRFSEAEQILEQYGVNQEFKNYWQIITAYNTGDIDEAIDKLELRVSNNENDVISRIDLARLIYEKNKDSVQTREKARDEAFKYLDKAQELQPDNINIHGLRAYIYNGCDQNDEAINVLNEYIKSYNNFNAFRLRGMFYENEGDYDLAEKDYTTLTKLEDNAQAGYQVLSNFYFGLKQYDKAISTIEKGLEEYPDNSSLERSLMRLLVLEGPTKNIERASEILEKLEKAFPQNADLIKFKAALLMENSTNASTQSAIGLLEDLIAHEPTDIDAYLMLIRITTDLGNYDVARDAAIKGLSISPANPSLNIARSRVELKSGNIQLAAQIADSVLQKYTGNAEASKIFISAAINSMDKTLLRQAEDIADTAIKNNPADEQIILARTNLFMRTGKPEMVLNDIETYCQTEPGKSSVNALMTLAELYRTSGENEKAEQVIEQALELEPDNLSVKHIQLFNLVTQKQYSELPGIIEAYFSADVNDLRLILEAGTILITLDSPELQEDGLNLFEYAYKIAPNSKDAGFSLASTLYRLQKLERAEQTYKELLEKFPYDSRVLNDYAWILFVEHKDYTRALELANQGLKLSPNDLHLLDTRGTILLESNNLLEQARIDFEKIVELSPSDSRQQARAYLSLGRISKKLNNDTKAKQYYQRAFEINQKINVFTSEELTEIQENIQ